MTPYVTEYVSKLHEWLNKASANDSSCYRVSKLQELLNKHMTPLFTRVTK